MRTLRVTIMGLGMKPARDPLGHEFNRESWKYEIRDAHTDELVIESEVWPSGYGDLDGYDYVEEVARNWIKYQMGTAPRSFDVDIPDGVGWTWAKVEQPGSATTQTIEWLSWYYSNQVFRYKSADGRTGQLMYRAKNEEQGVTTAWQLDVDFIQLEPFDKAALVASMALHSGHPAKAIEKYLTRPR